MTGRVLFLMSDTGGGHRASANAVGRALDHLYGTAVQWRLIDLLTTGAVWPLSRAPHWYEPLVTRLPWLWQFLWHLGEPPRLRAALVAALLARHRAQLSRFFLENPADLVVSVHPLLNHVPRAVLDDLQPATPFATVVTDLSTAHPIWYDAAVDLLCAAGVDVRDAALAAGVAGERIRLTGLPIDLQFAAPAPERQALRSRLGLAEDRATVLVMGGGAGIGPVAHITAALAGALADRAAQVVVICGRNERLRTQLARRSWPLPVHVLGFVTNMAQWMWAGDCLVTKAGPGTIAEALACGLPMVLSGYVPGQETGNPAYVTAHGAGAFCTRPAEIAEIVRGWLQPGSDDLSEMGQKARALARPRAALDVARALAGLIGLS